MRIVLRRAALLLLLAVLSGGCAKKPTAPLALAPMPAPHPPAGMRMTLISGAAIEAPESDAVSGGDRKKKLALPIIMAYVEHPLGNVLVDAGFGTRHHEHVKEFPANLFQRVMKPKFDPAKDAAVTQLAAQGVAAGDVKWLLATHMHWDHIGGLGDFPGARLLVTHAEWEKAHSSGGLTGAVRGYADSMYEDLRPETMLLVWPDAPYGTFERSVDLYGDGSIVLLDTSGHTPGSMSVLVTLPTGERFLFIGDAAWVRRGYKEQRHKGWKTRLLDNSRRGVKPTLARIAEFERLVPGVTVVPAHDPDTWAEVKHAPHWYGLSPAADEVPAPASAPAE